MRDSAAWSKTAWKKAALEKSRGVTLMGLIMVLFVLILLALFGMRLLPAYIEYGTAKKAITAIARDGTGASTPQEVRRQFDARALIDNIEVIKGSDLEIRKEGAGMVIGFAYRKEVPLVANVGLYIDFAANSAGQ
jgi:Na+-transporting methylmalonyl-CoA/oxaloacetate decarboxylase gamma subunit